MNNKPKNLSNYNPHIYKSVRFVAMVKKLLPLIFFILPFVGMAQNIETVTFDEPAYDERYFKSKLMVPLFRYQGPELEEYEKFGVEVKKGLEKFTIKKLPNMVGVDDTAYGFVYYTGAPAAINKGYITILVANHRRWTKPAIIYADKNNNLDFTDDGAADTFSTFTPTIHLSFPHPSYPAASYKVSLSRFPLDKDAKYRQMMDDYYRNKQGNKVFAGIDFSFKENRMNMRGSTYKGATDTFRIGLYDGNYDGLYTNAEYDRIYVAKNGDSIFLDDFRFFFEDGLRNAEFEWNFKVYKITELDPAGNFIKFYWDKNATSKKALKVGKKIPKFKFYLHDSKTTKKIKKYKKKGLYIYFYNFDSPGFEEDTAYLTQIHRRFGNCISVVTLNYGDYYKTIHAMKFFDSIQYTVGLSNRVLNRQFNIEKLPMGFLCRKRLKLSHIGITPKEVLELLEKGTPKKD